MRYPSAALLTIGLGTALAAPPVTGGAAFTQNSQFVLSSRDRANLLAVDFVATGPDGAPVTDLGASELTVRLGGKTRAVQGLEFVRALSDGPLPNRLAPFGDNAERRSPRSIILMVDEDTIRPGGAITVRDAAKRLIAGLTPGDRLALVTVPFGGLAVDLTTDHARVLHAMGALSSQGPRSESAEDAQCRTLTTLGAMTDTLLRLSAVEDPVTVVFFSSHQTGPENMIRMTSSRPGDPSVGSPCELRAETFTNLGTAASRARARFYVVHADLDQRGRGLAGLEHITGVTGGPLLHLTTGGGESAVARILAETAGHYVARVARESSDTAGEALNASVSTSRPGVTIWRAPRFVVTRPAPSAAAVTPATILELMQQRHVFRDLPLRITGHTYRDDAADHVKLAVTFDSPDASATLASAMVGAFDMMGRLVTGIEMSAEALTRRPVVAAFSVPPGSYRLRVAALESSGRAGSAEERLDAALTPVGALRASSLMIGLSRDGGFVPVMEFRDEPTAFGMLELYGTSIAPPRVVFEIAETTMGPALQTMPGLVEASPDATRTLVTAVLPIAQLPPGDYVIRATVTPEGQPAGRVMRGLRKVGK
jgi:hypothetical protein